MHTKNSNTTFLFFIPLSKNFRKTTKIQNKVHFSNENLRTHQHKTYRFNRSKAQNKTNLETKRLAIYKVRH